MAREIFISVTHADAGLAEALSDAMKALFGAIVRVYFSPSKELEGGIRHGEDWFDWIARHVQQCDFALILITPSSVQKPWILWEAGAVYGVAIAKGREGQRKVRPLVYQIDDAQIPSPIREAKAQFKRSDSFGDAKNLFKEIIDYFRDELTTDQLSEAFAKLDKVIESYMVQIKIVLLKSQLLEL